MFKEPVANDSKNPLISVLIHDYYGSNLRQCLEDIFTQRVLDNLEIIYVDSASSDGGWEIALSYAERYPGIMTLKRNYSTKRRTADLLQHGLEGRKIRLKFRTDLHEALLLAHGKYVVPLGLDEAFLPKYLKNCVAIMEADPLASFASILRRAQVPFDLSTVSEQPLVNVLIHNYNYGRYLRQCLDSVFAQTYRNFRIIFSDNASSDDSWQIALEYERKYPGMMTLIRNRRNFGPSYNSRNCYDCIDGKYFCTLCSDDAFQPDFIEKCVLVLEQHPETAFVMTHRTIIDEHGAPTDEPPFFNESCIISGPEQAAVYMMASVNPSISQIMYSRSKSTVHLPEDSLVSRWYAPRLLDFELCCHYSMAYIKEPLLINRVHSASDSSSISGNLLEAFGQYILPHQFAEMASRGDNMEKAIGRLPDALEKLGRLCLRYATRALAAGDEACARRYFHLSPAIFPGICEETIFQQLSEYWEADATKRAAVVEALFGTDNLATRSVSYDPPPGSINIEAELIKCIRDVPDHSRHGEVLQNCGTIP